jgi:hypothetical protein
MEITGATAKDADDTKLNDVTARETPDTVTDTNKTVEYVERGGTPKGPFGNQHKPGS